MAFDLDGCLIRSNVFKRDAYYEVFRDAGARFPALVTRVIAELPHGDRFEKIARILELSGVPESRRAGDVRRYADRYNELCESFAIGCDEVPGAERALRALSAVFPLYTNSATPQGPLRKVVEGRGWNAYFREVLGGPRSKVDNLRYIMARESAAPQNMVFIGDERRDQAAAAAVGCQFVGLRNAESDFEQPPKIEFDNMDDVARYLLARRSES